MTDRILSRRKTLTLGAAAAASATLGTVAAPAAAAPAKVPSIWEGEKMYTSFAEKATGLSYPGPAGRPKAYVAFDCQCPDCIKLMESIAPLYKYVDVVWCPISFLNIHSEPQGTTILMSKTPWKKLDEQHEHFRDADMRGIKYDIAKLDPKVRDSVWTNTKLHRRCGCRAVPYGVFKNKKGEYLPFDENMKTKELAELFGVEL